MKCAIMIYKSSKILQIFDFLNYVSHNMIQDFAILFKPNILNK